MSKKAKLLFVFGLLSILMAMLMTAYNLWDSERARMESAIRIEVLRSVVPRMEQADTDNRSGQLDFGYQVMNLVFSPVDRMLHSEYYDLTETCTAEWDAGTADRSEVFEEPEGIPEDFYEEESPIAVAEPMKTATVNGFDYIGILEVPAYELSLPVMDTWDYNRLRSGPCCFAGNYNSDDLVLCAHNYPTHFQKLKYAPLGTQILFTDVDGNLRVYETISVEMLEPENVEGMITGDWDLTLFTCTNDSASRCAIRCSKISI